MHLCLAHSLYLFDQGPPTRQMPHVLQDTSEPEFCPSGVVPIYRLRLVDFEGLVEKCACLGVSGSLLFIDAKDLTQLSGSLSSGAIRSRS